MDGVLENPFGKSKVFRGQSVEFTVLVFRARDPSLHPREQMKKYTNVYSGDRVKANDFFDLVVSESFEDSTASLLNSSNLFLCVFVRTLPRLSRRRLSQISKEDALPTKHATMACHRTPKEDNFRFEYFEILLTNASFVLSSSSLSQRNLATA